MSSLCSRLAVIAWLLCLTYTNEAAELRELSTFEAAKIFLNRVDRSLYLRYGIVIDSNATLTRVDVFDFDYYDRRPKSKDFAPSLLELDNAPLEALENYVWELYSWIAETVTHKGQVRAGVLLLVPRASLPLSVTDKTIGLLQQREIFKVLRWIDRERVYEWANANEGSPKTWLSAPTWRANGFLDFRRDSVQMVYLQERDLRDRLVAQLSNNNLQRAYLNVVAKSQPPGAEQSEWTLNSFTFQGFGMQSAQSAYLDLLVDLHRKRACVKQKKTWSGLFTDCASHDSNTDLPLIKDPCRPSGFSTEVTHDRPEVGESQSKTRVGRDLESGDGGTKITSKFQIVGSGSRSACRKLLTKLLKMFVKERHGCPVSLKDERQPCAVDLLGKRFVPFEQLRILGLSRLQSILCQGAAIDANGKCDHYTLMARAGVMCNTPYQNLASHFNTTDVGGPLSDLCFEIMWVDTFLNRGLRMPANYQNLRSSRIISSSSVIDWSLMGALNH